MNFPSSTFARNGSHEIADAPARNGRDGSAVKAEPARKEIAASEPVFNAEYLARLRAGDAATGAHFDRHFRRVLTSKLWNKFDERRRTDLVADIMAVAKTNILKGEPRETNNLSGYIFGICNILTAREINASIRTSDADYDFDRMPSAEASIEQTLFARERATEVRRVLESMRPRNREILVDLFFRDLSRDDVSSKHGVTREQMKMILFHARREFQKKWTASELSQAMALPKRAAQKAAE